MFVDRAKMTTATTGTGAITLGSASAGFQTFAAAGVTDGATVRYVIEDGTDWEIGTGTYAASGTILARSFEQSSTGSLLSLSGSAVVYVTAAAGDMPKLPTTAVFNYNGAWQPYTIPAGAKKLVIINIGAGGAGGAGFSRTAGSAGGGGGGGGAGGVTVTEVLVSKLNTSTLQVFPCQSNNGAVGTVSIAANTIAQNVLSRAVTGTAGGNGTASAAGTAGAAGAVTTNATTILAILGQYNFTAGQIGGAGGVQTGAVGASVTWGNTGLTTCAGAGGAGCTTTNFAGGAITGNGAVVANLTGGTAGGGAGQAGVTYSGWDFRTGGSGGGSNNSGTGGAGGAGAIGCGGGGGGAGVTGGAGGAGGHGQIIITAIF